MPTSTLPYVEWLGRAEGGVAALGGKGASLDRLGRLGHLTPAGFCVTTAAFRRQFAATPVAGAALERLPDEDARLSLEVAITTSPLDAEVAEAVRAALDEIVLMTGEGERSRLAVRSSGVGEDAAGASFAGLHETELGVAPAEVGTAIQRCWASLWSVPALFYRRRRGLPLDGGAMAVIVQALVPATDAAVVFTRHPVTGRDDHLCLTTARGLGEAMVSGTITPDTIVLDRASLEVVEHQPGDAANRSSLTMGQVRDLAALVLEVERAYGTPIDVEAAFDGSAWFLLQARPITTR